MDNERKFENGTIVRWFENGTLCSGEVVGWNWTNNTYLVNTGNSHVFVFGVLLEEYPTVKEKLAEQASEDTFEKLVMSMIDIHRKKNHDYGNSFDESCDEHGLVAAVVRMSDKMNRFKSLYKRPDAAKVEESLVDTLMDLANYSVMTASYILDHNKKKD